MCDAELHERLEMLTLLHIDVGSLAYRMSAPSPVCDTPHHPHYYHHQSTLSHNSSGPLSSTPTDATSPGMSLGGDDDDDGGDSTPVLLDSGGFSSLPVDLNDISPIVRNGLLSRDHQRLLHHHHNHHQEQDKQQPPPPSPADVWKRPPVPTSLPIKNPNRPAANVSNAMGKVREEEVDDVDDGTPTPTPFDFACRDVDEGSRDKGELLTNGLDPASLPPMVRRRKTPLDDAERIQRRSSYLKATTDQAVDLVAQDTPVNTPVEPKPKDGKRPESDSAPGSVKPASIELIRAPA
ncbi:unnamed protein product [Notodromas monacha]|uniref:Uncharacterized protein n=1 Tax=Notodromas monacha TaxID=399045 RepID=A0A7R9BSJ4_9CRUS|nr:unnamed protein product [Notodromas monacha]CAG0919566.1 unnamed protein product [Notodromas monacha]